MYVARLEVDVCVFDGICQERLGAYEIFSVHYIILVSTTTQSLGDGTNGFGDIAHSMQS